MSSTHDVSISHSSFAAFALVLHAIDNNAHGQTIKQLQQGWIWVSPWSDNSTSSPNASAAGLVSFTRSFFLDNIPAEPTTIHLTADTRYKLFINGQRVAVGPTRSTPSIWHYDSLDVTPWLRQGENEVRIIVIRYFPSSRAGLPFVRSSTPGLTLVGSIGAKDMGTGAGEWNGEVLRNVSYPTGRADDVFLHISETVTLESPENCAVVARPITIRNGEQGPVRLRPRSIPMPEETPLPPLLVVKSSCSLDDWTAFFTHSTPLNLPRSTTLDLRAATHSTAFLRWTFRSAVPARVRLKVTYSEGYEREPRMYPWLRTKDDRSDPTGLLIGPSDTVEMAVDKHGAVYEPFWIRTFAIMRWEIEVISGSIELVGFNATQTNYPMDVKAQWHDPEEPHAAELFDVSVRTLRNCMLDGYSDCPFYEQLQYSGDTRFVALFHYFLSGDDRLARQAITLFASSVSPEGLLQSRVPSHVQQIVLGFSLYWILMVSDHYMYFGDTAYTRSFLPIVDGILEYFERHIDALGLVSGVEPEIWQYIDWVKTWAPGPNDGDKGVPPAGRSSNRYTFFSLLYVYTLNETADLLERVGRRGLVEEYRARASRTSAAVQEHCFDGTLYTDSTVDASGSDKDGAYSWHCQIFAILSGTVDGDAARRLLCAAKAQPDISVCSYAMRFYEFRAYAKAGMYDTIFPAMFDPWKVMLANHMTTWAEDDIRQRSDCHAWSAVPLYEFYVELCGLSPIEPGARAIRFMPRLDLRKTLKARCCIGPDLVVDVEWSFKPDVGYEIDLRLSRPVRVVGRSPWGEEDSDLGVITHRHIGVLHK